MRCCAVQHKKCALSKCAKRSAGKSASIVRVCMRMLRATGIGKTPFEQGRRFTHPSPALRAVGKAWKGKTTSCEKGTGTRSAVSDGWQRIVHLSCILLLGCLPAGGASETVRRVTRWWWCWWEWAGVCVQSRSALLPISPASAIDSGFWLRAIFGTVGSGFGRNRSRNQKRKVRSLASTCVRERSKKRERTSGRADRYGVPQCCKVSVVGQSSKLHVQFCESACGFFFGGDSSENLNY